MVHDHTPPSLLTRSRSLVVVRLEGRSLDRLHVDISSGTRSDTCNHASIVDRKYIGTSCCLLSKRTLCRGWVEYKFQRTRTYTNNYYASEKPLRMSQFSRKIDPFEVQLLCSGKDRVS